MLAIQRYKIHPLRDIIHEVTGLNGVGCWRSQNLMADPSTTTALILGLIAGDCRSRCQLRNGIMYVPVASKPMNSLSFCAGCIRYQAGDILLDGRYLHNGWTDFDSVSGRWLGLTPDFQQYKVRLCCIRTQDVTVFCGEYLYCNPVNPVLNSRLLHNR